MKMYFLEDFDLQVKQILLNKGIVKEIEKPDKFKDVERKDFEEFIQGDQSYKIPTELIDLKDESELNPPPPKGERPNGSFTQWSVTVHQSQVIIVVSLLLLSFGQLKSFSERMF